MKLYLSRIVCLLLIIFFSGQNFAQLENAEEKIKEIINNAGGKVGAAVIDLETGKSISVNDDYCYPMQSVYKFPLALAVLNEIDKENFKLDTKVLLNKSDLLPNTWSPLREKYPGGGVEVTIAELIEYTVGKSDNNGCDILFRYIGGPEIVNEYISRLGIEDINILSTEEEMHKDDLLQYKNCARPSAMSSLLVKFFNDNILSENSKEFLFDVMSNKVFPSKRIPGNLPEGTVTAHKTGSSGKNKSGIAAATNDAGIVFLPDGRKFAVTVFVTDSPDDDKLRDKVIADITKAVWDSYIEK